jgi:Resolvase, N terminal domain
MPMLGLLTKAGSITLQAAKTPLQSRREKALRINGAFCRDGYHAEARRNLRPLSTDKADHSNQVAALRQIAERRGRDVVEQYHDAGISGAKGRDGRPGLDQMLNDAQRRKFDVIMAWAIDRLSRSLIDLLGTIQSLEACPRLKSASKRICVVARACARSRASWVLAPARCSASGRRWKALSSAQPREAEGAQMKLKRPPPDVRYGSHWGLN